LLVICTTESSTCLNIVLRGEEVEASEEELVFWEEEELVFWEEEELVFWEEEELDSC
jgi:hypothetical protein